MLYFVVRFFLWIVWRSCSFCCFWFWCWCYGCSCCSTAVCLFNQPFYHQQVHKSCIEIKFIIIWKIACHDISLLFLFVVVELLVLIRRCHAYKQNVYVVNDPFIVRGCCHIRLRRYSFRLFSVWVPIGCQWPAMEKIKCLFSRVHSKTWVKSIAPGWTFPANLFTICAVDAQPITYALLFFCLHLSSFSLSRPRFGEYTAASSG